MKLSEINESSLIYCLFTQQNCLRLICIWIFSEPDKNDKNKFTASYSIKPLVPGNYGNVAPFFITYQKPPPHPISMTCHVNAVYIKFQLSIFSYSTEFNHLYIFQFANSHWSILSVPVRHTTTIKCVQCVSFCLLPWCCRLQGQRHAQLIPILNRWELWMLLRLQWNLFPR